MRPTPRDQKLTISALNRATLATKYGKNAQPVPVEHSTPRRPELATICPVVTARMKADPSGQVIRITLRIDASKARTREELHTEIVARLHKRGLRLWAVLSYGVGEADAP